MNLEEGPTGSGSTTSSTTHASSSRELDQLFLLQAAGLQTGEAMAEWWFRWRAEAQDTYTPESLDDLLRDSLKGIAQALDADAVAVLLADESGELVARAATGIQPELWRPVQIAVGAGMAGRVVAERRPMVVDDLSTIEIASATLRDSGVRSLVAVPIPGRDRLIGVLHADSYELGHFSQRHATLLSLVADRLGSAMEQVRLFESERAARSQAEMVADRMARLQRVTASLSRDLSAEAVAQAVQVELAEDIDGEAVSHLIWLVEGDRMRLISEVGDSQAGPFAEMSVDDPLPGPEVVRSGEALWFETAADIDAFEALDQVKLDAEALAVLPLWVEGQVLGVLAVGYPRARTFSPQERLFLSLVARQTAESLHRAGVRQARIRAAFANQVLADVSAALGSSLDLPTTLRRALEELVPRMADMASCHVLDELGVPRRLAIAHRDPDIDADVSQAPEDPVHEAQSLLATLQSAGAKPILVAEGADFTEAVAVDDEHVRQLRELGIASAIAVPLHARGQQLGLLGLMRMAGSEPYTEEDLELAAEIGDRASTAIDNALQHERRVAVARALQASLLPPELSEVPGAEVAAVFHASSAGVDVGGDFYDLFPVDSGRWVLMIGDVSGSGPAAAALTAQVRHGARVAARAGLDPPSVVAAVNATLDETTGSEWFCTMVYAELVPHDDGIDLQVICAGHVAPLVVAGGQVEELECQAPLLGVLPGAQYAARRLRLAPGHALVMVTDGATEARAADRHGSDSFFGEARLQEVVAKAAGSDAEGIVDAVSEAVLSFAGGQLDDDLALVALRAVPVGQKRGQ
jgi:serine phosphatase RsbU (regulator of sigma subunit)/putative methionine-R-sulfoxide reductase with GAF domain